MFLHPQDYKPYIRAEIKEDILLDQTEIIRQVEQAAQAQMESYLSGRYDTSKIFIPVLTWNDETNYSAGAYVYAENEAGTGLVFKASVNVTAGSGNPWDNIEDPTPANIVWEIEDPRNPVIVLKMIYMTLYHGHKALPGNRIPQLRIDDYSDAIRWLEKIAEGKINPILPEAVVEGEGIASWGSETRRNTRW
jgi:phage gp36-like protein